MLQLALKLTTAGAEAYIRSNCLRKSTIKTFDVTKVREHLLRSKNIFAVLSLISN